jgi:hypothetical protein
MAVASGPQSLIPFAFAPIPRSAPAALRAGELSPAAYRILTVFYDRANQDTWISSFQDLDAIGRCVAWEFTLDYLSKCLRELREKGWIAYESAPGRKHHGYTIRLIWKREETSESDDLELDKAVRAQSEHRFGSGTGLEPHRETLPEPTSPSIGGVSPSTKGAATAEPVRDSAVRRTAPVRAPRDVRDKTTSEPSGKGEGSRSRLALDREGEQNKGHALLPDVLATVNRARQARGEDPLPNTGAAPAPVSPPESLPYSRDEP